MTRFISNTLVRGYYNPCYRGFLKRNTSIQSYNKYISSSSGKGKSKIVILGSGWSSLHFIAKINTRIYDLTVISPRNYFVFTPFLPKICSGYISSETCAEPISPYVHKITNGTGKFIHASCIDVDSSSNSVICKSLEDDSQSFSVPYDYLVISVGAENNTFNIHGVDKYAHFLKELEHAEEILQKLLDNFRKASMPYVSEDEKYRLLHIVIVGGGPTGVESSGEISVLFNKYCQKSFPDLLKYTKVTIVEGGTRLLPSFSNKNSAYVSKVFKKSNITMLMKRVVCEVTCDGCVVKDTESGATEEIKCGMVLWASGLKETKLISTLQKKWNVQNIRSLPVDQYLKLHNHNNIFALGDCCKIVPSKLSDNLDHILEEIGGYDINSLIRNRKKLMRTFPQLSELKWNYNGKNFRQLVHDTEVKYGKGTKECLLEILKHIDNTYISPFPTAQNAKQEAIYLAKTLNAMYYTPNNSKIGAFNERWLGSLASLGGKYVVLNFPFMSVNGGMLAFFIWNIVYLFISPSWKMRANFLLDSVLNVLCGRRLISKCHKK